MRQTFYILTIVLLLTSCKEEKRVVEKIDFKTDYKFSSEIEQQISANTTEDSHQGGFKHQEASSNYANKGDYKNALIQWDLAMGIRDQNYSEFQIDSINQKYSKIKAADFIVEQAKENQIVIINEAHHNSFHRLFTKLLLQKLYDNGYKNLGLEAIFLDSNLNKRKYPIQETGYYIKDPQFGDLVRTAIQIGYNVFPYEPEHIAGNTAKQREIGQAKNIQKIIDSKPNEKFLIHCGYDHALEGKLNNSWGKAMAGRLTEYTGINPLTINQVLFSEKSKPKYNHPFLKALNIKESSVLINKDNKPLRYERGDAWTDIAVFHPNTNYINDRPNWLFENGNEKNSITLNDIQIEFPVMVLAFKKDEDINLAVPIDITEVKNKTENCILGLKQGDYDIVVTNGKESFKFEQKVK